MSFAKYLIILAVVVISIASIGCTNFTTVRVEGAAMLPTFKDGDRIFVDKNIGEIKRGDIIIFYYPKDTTKIYFKRVIGLPHETVSILNGKVTINDSELDEPYVDQIYNQLKSSYPPVKVSEKSYFVLGDNRDNSSDSRFWGTVKEELIVGRCYLAC